MAEPIIPPGGFIGFGQQTMATQALLRKKRTTKKRRAKKKPARRGARVSATRRKSPAKKRVARKKPARLVKGSRAAKAHMAKLRRMRK